MTTKLNDRHLTCVAGAVRGELEHQSDTTALETPWELGLFSEVEDEADLFDGQVAYTKKVPRHADSSSEERCSPRARSIDSPSSQAPSSHSSSDTVRGGARRITPGTGVLTTRPTSSASCSTALESIPSSRTTPIKRPAPRTDDTPARAAIRAFKCSPRSFARRGASIATIVSSVAFTADIA